MTRRAQRRRRQFMRCNHMSGVGWKPEVVRARAKRREWFWSKDDETAKKQAEQCVDGHDIELWHQDKKIAECKNKQ